MATLEKIRNRAGVLVATVIGLALLAFILGDLFSSGRSLFSSQQYEIANIAGKSIPVQAYQSKVDQLAEIYKMNTKQSALDEQTMDGIREQTWQQMVQENVMGEEYKKTGIGVSSEEVYDLVTGKNPHPIIRQMFTNPQTGELNRSAILQFLKTMDQDQTGEQKAFWLYLENEIIRERKMTKFTNLVKQGLYVTSLETKDKYYEDNKKVDFEFLVRRYNVIPDSAVKYSESDLKSYYDAHENDYKQTASRDIDYVAFEIKPSESDYQDAEKYIEDLKKDFINTEDNEQFVNLNSDVPFNPMHFKKEDLSPLIADSIFDAPVGTVVGPYFEDEAYKLAKLNAIAYLPDSVKARHILLQPVSQNPQAIAQTKALADSLMTLLANGADFAKLAMQYSKDGSAQQGGDLGWFKEGQMVKEFNDAAFSAEVGKVQQVNTQYGIHLLEVTAKSQPVKKVQLALVQRLVEPSSQTYQDYYSKASKFAGLNNTEEKFENAVKEEGLNKRIANNILENDKQIPGLESPRELIRWVYNADEGDVSSVFELGNKFVIAHVTAVREDGIAPLEQVKNDVELNVIKEKKAEELSSGLAAQVKENKSLEEIAQGYSSDVQQASNISFSSFSVPGAGIEPKVIATATNIQADKISDPVDGNNGVYILKVTSINEPAQTDDYTMQRIALERANTSRAGYEAFNALKKLADIEDYRSKFY